MTVTLTSWLFPSVRILLDERKERKIKIDSCSFASRMLRKDKEEVEAIKHAKALEAEKAMYSVR